MAEKNSPHCDFVRAVNNPPGIMVTSNISVQRIAAGERYYAARPEARQLKHLKKPAEKAD